MQASQLQSTQVQMTPKQRMEAKKQAEILRREEELRQAAHGAKQNYAQAKFAKLSNAYDSMTSNNRIITDASQLPNQENFFVPA